MSAAQGNFFLQKKRRRTFSPLCRDSWLVHALKFNVTAFFDKHADTAKVFDAATLIVAEFIAPCKICTAWRLKAADKNERCAPYGTKKNCNSFGDLTKMPMASFAGNDQLVSVRWSCSPVLALATCLGISCAKYSGYRRAIWQQQA